MFDEQDKRYFNNIKNLLDSAERYQSSSNPLYRDLSEKKTGNAESEIKIISTDATKKNEYLSYAPLEKVEKIFLREDELFSIVPQLWFQASAFQEKFTVSGPSYLCQIVRLAFLLLEAGPFSSLNLTKTELLNKFSEKNESVYKILQGSTFINHYLPTVQSEDLCKSLRLHALFLIYYEFVVQFIKAKELANKIIDIEENKKNSGEANNKLDEKTENILMSENAQENEFAGIAELRKKSEQKKIQKKLTDLMELFIGSNFLLDPYARLAFQTQMAVLDLNIIRQVTKLEKNFLQKVYFVFELLNLLQRWNVCTNLVPQETHASSYLASSGVGLAPIFSFSLKESGYIKSTFFDVFSTEQRNGEIPVFTLQNINQTIRATLINLQSNAKNVKVNPDMNFENISIQVNYAEEAKKEETVVHSNSDVFSYTNINLENLKSIDWSNVKQEPAVIRFLVSLAKDSSLDKVMDYFPERGYGYSLGLALSSYLTKKEEELCTLINNRIRNNDLTSDEALGYQIALQMFVFKHISCLQKYLLLLSEDKEKIFDKKFASLGFQRLPQNAEQTAEGCDYASFENRKKLSQAVHSLKGHSSKNPEIYVSVIRLLQSYVKTLVLSGLFAPELSKAQAESINEIWKKNARDQHNNNKENDNPNYKGNEIANEFKKLRPLLAEYLIFLQEQISLQTFEERQKNNFALDNLYQLLEVMLDPELSKDKYFFKNNMTASLAFFIEQKKSWAQDLHLIFSFMMFTQEKLEEHGELHLLKENSKEDIKNEENNDNSDNIISIVSSN